MQALRNSIRNKRRSLTSVQQRLASQRLYQQLKNNSFFLSAKHIAVYQAMDGELDLKPIIQAAWRLNKFCYLPSVKKNTQRLDFFVYKKASRLRKKQFGIIESRSAKKFQLRRFDLVLMPLVAFDKQGFRLGMGGGYYDYSFQHLLKPKGYVQIKRTRLLGIAHRCQQVEKITQQDWDLKPDKIFSA